PIDGNIDSIAKLLENAASNLLIDDVILSQQQVVLGLAHALRAQGMARYDGLGRHPPALGLCAEHHHQTVGQISVRDRLQKISRESQFREEAPVAALPR